MQPDQMRLLEEATRQEAQEAWMDGDEKAARELEAAVREMVMERVKLHGRAA